MKRLAFGLCTVLSLLAAPSSPHWVAFVGLSAAPLLSGCVDACDKQRADCEDQGLEVIECKEEKNLYSDKCTCFCASGGIIKPARSE